MCQKKIIIIEEKIKQYQETQNLHYFALPYIEYFRVVFYDDDGNIQNTTS